MLSSEIWDVITIKRISVSIILYYETFRWHHDRNRNGWNYDRNWNGNWGNLLSRNRIRNRNYDRNRNWGIYDRNRNWGNYDRNRHRIKWYCSVILNDIFQDQVCYHALFELHVNVKLIDLYLMTSILLSACIQLFNICDFYGEHKLTVSYTTCTTQEPAKNKHRIDHKAWLKLYCGYLYTRLCMINCIWGLKTTMTTGEWLCLISFAWDPLSCSEQAGIEKFKMKIYVSSGIRTHKLRATTSDTVL